MQSEGVQENTGSWVGGWVRGWVGVEASDFGDGIEKLFCRGSQVVFLMPAFFKELEEERWIRCVLKK